MRSIYAQDFERSDNWFQLHLYLNQFRRSCWPNWANQRSKRLTDTFHATFTFFELDLATSSHSESWRSVRKRPFEIEKDTDQVSDCQVARTSGHWMKRPTRARAGQGTMIINETTRSLHRAIAVLAPLLHFVSWALTAPCLSTPPYPPRFGSPRRAGSSGGKWRKSQVFSNNNQGGWAALARARWATCAAWFFFLNIITQEVFYCGQEWERGEEVCVSWRRLQFTRNMCCLLTPGVPAPSTTSRDKGTRRGGFVLGGNLANKLLHPV